MTATSCGSPRSSRISDGEHSVAQLDRPEVQQAADGARHRRARDRERAARQPNAIRIGAAGARGADRSGSVRVLPPRSRSLFEGEFPTAIQMLRKSAGIEPKYASTWAHVGRGTDSRRILRVGRPEAVRGGAGGLRTGALAR